MIGHLPSEVDRLLEAPDALARDRAWEDFVRAHSRLLYRTAQAHTNGYDDTMDRYAFVLEQLRSEECKRLRAFRSRGAGTFTTWLVAVAHRLCIDHHRQRYGRHRSTRPQSGFAGTESAARRQIIELLGVDIDIDEIVDDRAADPAQVVQTRELLQRLEKVLAGLGPRDRMLLKMRYEDGASVREITKAMRWPSQFHVYRQLKKILTRMRKTMEAQGVTGSSP